MHDGLGQVYPDRLQRFQGRIVMGRRIFRESRLVDGMIGEEWVLLRLSPGSG